MLKSNHTFLYFSFPFCVVFFVFLSLLFLVGFFFGGGGGGVWLGWMCGWGGRGGLLSLSGNPSPTLAELSLYKARGRLQSSLDHYSLYHYSASVETHHLPWLSSASTRQEAGSRAALITTVCTITKRWATVKKVCWSAACKPLLQNHTRSPKLNAVFAWPRLKKTSDTLVFPAFSNSAPKHGNALPQAITEADSLTAFHRRLKPDLFCKWLRTMRLFLFLYFNYYHFFSNPPPPPPIHPFQCTELSSWWNHEL